MDFPGIEALIRAEQARAKGEFIKYAPIDVYLEKLKSKAEFVDHSVEGECAGFVAFYCNDYVGRIAFITLVLVSPEYRGLGISKCLLRRVLDVCRSRDFEKCCLEVRANNVSAIRLYDSFGFTVTEDRKGAYLMTASLR